jgi:catechol 2,3-dioxygenase
MRVIALGHAVIKVRDIDRSLAFYNGVLGMAVAARYASPNGPMAFLTLGNHHDLALLEKGSSAPAPERDGVGLFHLAFKVGDTIEELRETKAHLEERGVTVERAVDHDVTLSLYLEDPDGNGIELYVDASDGWKEDPQRVAGGTVLRTL